MIKYRLTTRRGECTLTVNVGWTSLGEIVYEGSKEAIKDVKDWLSTQYGPYGHIFNLEETSPMDLSFLMEVRGVIFNAELIEGKRGDLKTTIPEGAIT